jgi:hypothetical protein
VYVVYYGIKINISPIHIISKEYLISKTEFTLITVKFDYIKPNAAESLPVIFR